MYDQIMYFTGTIIENPIYSEDEKNGFKCEIRVGCKIPFKAKFGCVANKYTIIAYEKIAKDIAEQNPKLGEDISAIGRLCYIYDTETVRYKFFIEAMKVEKLYNSKIRKRIKGAKPLGIFYAE